MPARASSRICALICIGLILRPLPLVYRSTIQIVNVDRGPKAVIINSVYPSAMDIRVYHEVINVVAPWVAAVKQRTETRSASAWIFSGKETCVLEMVEM
jgi:hypothetical protein